MLRFLLAPLVLAAATLTALTTVSASGRSDDFGVDPPS